MKVAGTNDQCDKFGFVGQATSKHRDPHRCSAVPRSLRRGPGLTETRSSGAPSKHGGEEMKGHLERQPSGVLFP
jgi:hypothetical protein